MRFHSPDELSLILGDKPPWHKGTNDVMGQCTLMSPVKRWARD